MYKNPVCKGSWELGTACGHCERCLETKPKPIVGHTYKVGDWVVPSHYAINRFKGPQQISKLSIVKPISYLIDNSWCGLNDFELWSPTKYSWCWFWDKYNNNYTLAQFKDKTVGGYYHTIKDDRPQKDKMLANFYSHCEPFIGKLPSYIKDKNG